MISAYLGGDSYDGTYEWCDSGDRGDDRDGGGVTGLLQVMPRHTVNRRARRSAIGTISKANSRSHVQFIWTLPC
jgi:hypothetical protein